MYGELMKVGYLALALVSLILLATGAFAYSGFNRYYYTDNYYPTVYYTAPYAVAYSYPSYYYSYRPVYGYYAAPVVVPTYYAPSYYSGMSFYSSGDSWGISISRGSVCSYYGYC